MKLTDKAALTYAVVVLVLAFAGVINASAQNVILNPDFETGDLSDWEAYGESPNSYIVVQSGDNGPTLPGSHNAFLYNTGNAIGLTLKQVTPIGSVGGGEVFYSFDLKLDQAEVGGVLFAEIFAEQSGVGIVGGTGLMGPFWAWEWTNYTGSFIAPDGTDFLSIQFVAVTGAAEGTSCIAHVDNVDVNQGAVPAETTSFGAIKSLY